RAPPRRAGRRLGARRGVRARARAPRRRGRPRRARARPPAARLVRGVGRPADQRHRVGRRAGPRRGRRRRVPRARRRAPRQGPHRRRSGRGRPPPSRRDLRVVVREEVRPLPRRGAPRLGRAPRRARRRAPRRPVAAHPAAGAGRADRRARRAALRDRALGGAGEALMAALRATAVRALLLALLPIAVGGCGGVPLTPAAISGAPVPEDVRRDVVATWREAVALANDFLASPFRATLPAGRFELADDAGMRFVTNAGSWPIAVYCTTWGDVCVAFGFAAQEREWGFVVGSMAPERDRLVDNSLFVYASGWRKPAR